MANDFKDIEIGEILNYDHAETAVIARYERIMQHRTIEAINGLSDRLEKVVGNLEGVMTTIYRVGQLAEDKAEHAIISAGKARQLQRSQQTVMKWLTRTLVICIFFYTLINAVVAYEIHQGNEIQRAVAIAAIEQAAAARDSAEVQRVPSASPLSEQSSGTDNRAGRVKTGQPPKAP